MQAQVQAQNADEYVYFSITDTTKVFISIF